MLGTGLLVLVALVSLISNPLTASMAVGAGYQSLNSAASLTGEARDRELERAVADLEQAHRLQPGDVAVMRQFAQAYLQSGNAAAAVALLERAYRQSPTDRLTASELAMAYISAGEIDSASAIWAELGYSMSALELAGDADLMRSDYAGALQWYSRIRTPTKPQADLLGYKLWLAAFMQGELDNEPRQDFYRLTGAPLCIPGSAFRWMLDIPGTLALGTPLSYMAPNPGSVGYFWWSGHALAAVSVAQAGTYDIRIRLRQSAPSPVHMALGADSNLAYPISLERGDDSWTTVVVTMQLEPGPHTIDLWFLNNAVVNGKDRDAWVDWVELQLQS